MKFLLILLLVYPLSLAAPGESSSQSEDPIQKAIGRHRERVNMVLAMTENGESINGVLKPLNFLGSGVAGFVFKGIRSQDSISVAIKFFPESSANNAKREYEMYSYLNAIDNAEAQKYGIPTVYYYGHWQNLTVTAYTELDKTLADHGNSASYRYYNYDIILLIKQFIKQSKYIHSRGVRHDVIKPEYILTQGCASYLSDFDYASKMFEDDGGTTYLYASLKYHQGVGRVATDDWESFLYTICHMAGIQFDWFKKDVIKTTKNDEEAMELYAELKSNRKRIREVIKQSERGILKLVILAFANEAFSEKPLPDYDNLYRIVNDALAQYFPEKKCFSWTTEQFKNGTIVDNESNRKMLYESFERANTNIGDLLMPNDFNGYAFFIYPDVNEKFFENWGSE